MRAKSRCLHGGRGRRVGVKWGTGPPPGLGTVLKAQGSLAGELPLVMKIGQGGWREVPLSKSHPRGWKRKASES